jgi:hypothetical protein
MSPCHQRNNIVMHGLSSCQIANKVSGAHVWGSGKVLILTSEHTRRARSIATIKPSAGDVDKGWKPESHRSHLSLLLRHGSQLRILRERLVKGAES